MTDEHDEHERATHTIPLDTDDGEQVVLGQEAVGRPRLAGGGEFADAHGPRDPADVAHEQAELDADATTPPADDPLPPEPG